MPYTNFSILSLNINNQNTYKEKLLIQKIKENLHEINNTLNTESTITESTITESTITESTITESTITESTITESTFIQTKEAKQFTNCIENNYKNNTKDKQDKKDKKDTKDKKDKKDTKDKTDNIQNLPDLIFTQESNKLFFTNNYNNLTNNKSSIYKHFTTFGKLNEKVGVFYNSYKITNPDKELKVLVELESNSEKYTNLPFMARYGIIIDYKGVSIANIHLEGGCVSDALLKSNNLIKDVVKFKLDLLIKTLKYNPDIILGDFNSQYLLDDSYIIKNKLIFKNKIDTIRFSYFKDYIKNFYYNDMDLLAEKNLLYYSELPHYYLKKNGYRIKCNNIDTINTSGIGKSVVDAIYYNTKKIIPITGLIIDCGKTQHYNYFGGVSDHNPIYLKYKLKIQN